MGMPINVNANPAANSNVTLYTPPEDTAGAAVHVNLANRSCRPLLVKLAIATPGAPGSADWIVPGHVLELEAPLLLGPIVIPDGKRLVVWCDVASVSAQVWGEVYESAEES